jgi:hypothetical protein
VFVTEKKQHLDIEMPLTYNFSNIAAEKVTKYETFALGIKTIWKLNNISVYTLGIPTEGEVTRSFQIYLEIIGLTKNKTQCYYKCVFKKTTLTEVFPCFSLSCKANARV